MTRLATIRRPDGRAGTCCVRLDHGAAVPLDAADVVQLLAQEDWPRQLDRVVGPPLDASTLDYAPVVRPQHTVCVGMNYRAHIAEMGRSVPEHPTLFAKFPDALIGAGDEIVLPAVSSKVDWEVELGVIVGRRARAVSPAEATAHIAGYTVVNDVSMRDWQWRTSEWLQGKTFEASTPVGPVLVTPDELGDPEELTLRCEVDGAVMQEASTGDMVFGPAALVSYVSQFMTLWPGDLIATGTPAGVGAGREPMQFLQPGQMVRASVEGIGACENHCARQTAPSSQEPG